MAAVPAPTERVSGGPAGVTTLARLALYLVLILIASWLVRRLERRLGANEGHPSR